MSQSRPSLGAASDTRHAEYAQSLGLAPERLFFSINPALLRDVRMHQETACHSCGFDFVMASGRHGVGLGYLHHLVPALDRPQFQWRPKLREDVTRIVPLCAQCHLVVHRRSPPLGLEELQELLAQPIAPRGRRQAIT